MYRYIIEDARHVPPFNEPASLLTIGTQPLKIHHEELLASYFGTSIELKNVYDSGEDIKYVEGEALVYRDNLWFDEEFFVYFMEKARKTGRACRAAIPADDKAYRTYALPLGHGFKPAFDETGDAIYVMDLWYFPAGYTTDVLPCIVPSDYREMGFYSVPDFMTMEQGDLTHYAPMRSVVSIESWVHIYFASIIFGTFARAGRMDEAIEKSFFQNLKLLWYSLVEQKQLLSASGAVEIGTGCNIAPSATITGPAKIGNNVSIGAGAIIDNCTIGDNVTIDAGCMMYQSVIGNNCFLPFRAALYLTTLMENVIVSQNTCLQMCVIGRNSFVGAGNTFTDFNLIAQKPIRVTNQNGNLEPLNQIVMGSAVGHNCRIGSGMIVMPGRMIESDVVLIASPQRRVIGRTVTFEESDHHFVRGGEVHQRFYRRENEETPVEEEQW